MSKQIIIIGGGAAGFFCAIAIAEKRPDYRVLILEKSEKLLAKVSISGGGRCNVTNIISEPNELIKNYPRGSKELLQVFSRFNSASTVDWFKAHGIRLVAESDGRMFPESNTSATVVNCFLDLTKSLGISIQKGTSVNSILKQNNHFTLNTSQGPIIADVVVCAFGGHPKLAAYDLIQKTGHTIQSPIPSLFTFNLHQEKINKLLQGISVQQAEVKIEGKKLSYAGPVLVTHWGLSGPAVLKLSAFGASELHNAKYTGTIVVNWLFPKTTEDTIADLLLNKSRSKSSIKNTAPAVLPKRLWEFILEQAEIDGTKVYSEISDKQLRKLAELLCRNKYKMQGKTTFKEEFVTSGGVTLKEIDFKTMQSKLLPGLYFCGECLNIDGITGGFNFQSAWSTAFVAASAISA